MITPSNEAETIPFPPSIEDDGGSGEVGSSNGRIASVGDAGPVSRLSGEGVSREELRTASRGVTFSSPDSNASTPNRWDSSQMKQQQLHRRSRNESSGRRGLRGANSQAADMSVNGKGERQLTESESDLVEKKREMAWRKETYSGGMELESLGYGRGSSSFRILRTAGGDVTDSCDTHSMLPVGAQLPSLFACAWKVKIPYVGDQKPHDLEAQPIIADKGPFPMQQDIEKSISKAYLRLVASDFQFGNDVIQTRVPETLPYDMKRLRSIFDPSDIVDRETRYLRGADTPSSCSSMYSLSAPIGPNWLVGKRRKPAGIVAGALEHAQRIRKRQKGRRNTKILPPLSAKAKRKENLRDKDIESWTNRTFGINTELKSSRHNESEKAILSKVDESHSVGDVLLYRMKNATAKWIATQNESTEKTPSDIYDNKTTTATGDVEGLGTKSRDATIRKQITSEEEESTSALLSQTTFDILTRRRPEVKKKWISEEARRVQKAVESYQSEPDTKDETKRDDGTEEGEDLGPEDINQTATLIKDLQYRFLVGRDSDTSSPFKQKSLPPPPGSKPFGDRLSQIPPSEMRITPVDQEHSQRQLLQDVYPLAPQQWLVKKRDKEREGESLIWNKGYPEMGTAEDTNEGRLHFGMRRWRSEISDDEEEELVIAAATGLRDQKGRHSAMSTQDGRSSVVKSRRAKTSSSIVTKPLIDGDTDSASEDMVKIRRTQSVTKIADKWREKWSMGQRWEETSPEKILAEMGDIQPHVRLQAVNTVTRAAHAMREHEKSVALKIKKLVTTSKKEPRIPQKVIEGVRALLLDKSVDVARGSALCLYALKTPSTDAQRIMRETLEDANAFNRWTAAQTLALYADADSRVIQEIVSQMMDNNEDSDPIKNEQATSLLVKLSGVSHYLVHSLVAERLNSTSWQDRVKSCVIMPKLDGGLTKDIANKLSTMMWRDWHKTVRKVAAQTLGKTGNGKLVHNILLQKLEAGNEMIRIEAVAMMGHLGILTAQLLPRFLDTFNDEYVNVRKQACVTARDLRTTNELVVADLLRLATFDPDWNVKAQAIKSLGNLGQKTEDIKKCLLWAMRYEDKAGVRAQACNSLVCLRYYDDDVSQIIQDRYLVESSDEVKVELGAALEEMGIETTKELDLVIQIKGEVRKLGTQTNIISQLSALEQSELIERHEKRLLPGTAANPDDVTSGTPSDLSGESGVNSVFQSRKNSEYRLEEFKSFSQSLSQSLQEVDLRRENQIEKKEGGEIREAVGGGDTPTLAPQEDETKQDKETENLTEVSASTGTDEDDASSLTSDAGGMGSKASNAEAMENTPTNAKTEHPEDNYEHGQPHSDSEGGFGEESLGHSLQQKTEVRSENNSLVVAIETLVLTPTPSEINGNENDADGKSMDHTRQDESNSEYPESIDERVDTPRTALEEASLRTASPTA